MSITYCFTVFTRIPLLPNKCSNMVRIAVYLIAKQFQSCILVLIYGYENATICLV